MPYASGIEIGAKLVHYRQVVRGYGLLPLVNLVAMPGLTNVSLLESFVRAVPPWSLVPF